MSASFMLLVEDNENGQFRVLEYKCKLDDDKCIIILEIRNARTGNVVVDRNNLPDTKKVLKASKLSDWHFNHEEVFTSYKTHEISH
jgi:hypothetical protein